MFLNDSETMALVLEVWRYARDFTSFTVRVHKGQSSSNAHPNPLGAFPQGVENGRQEFQLAHRC